MQPRLSPEIFNTSHKGQFLILNLTLRLSLTAEPRLAYPDVKAWFDERNVKAPTLAQVRAAIISIRDRKFPYPRTEQGGNAGSFFKNVTLGEKEYQALDQRIHDNFGPAERAVCTNCETASPEVFGFPRLF